jgi:hypothetical protein
MGRLKEVMAIDCNELKGRYFLFWLRRKGASY